MLKKHRLEDDLENKVLKKFKKSTDGANVIITNSTAIDIILNGKVEYMDPDPFFYGSTTRHNHDFHEMVRKYPNPVSIY